MAIRINYDQSDLYKSIDSMGAKLGAELLMYSSTKAAQLQAIMKQRRPWTDRTGMAKATLNARVSRPSEDIIRITLAHGVSYGIDLELKHGKAYAIVGPTIDIEGPKVISELSGLMSKINLR